MKIENADGAAHRGAAMNTVDTSGAEVERLAALWEQSSWAGGGFTHTRAAALLRALAARAERAEAERDAARAEVASLRQSLAAAMPGGAAVGPTVWTHIDGSCAARGGGDV